MPKKYTDEFKTQIVELHNSGVRQCDLMRQFNLSKRIIQDWRQQYASCGKFGVSETLSPEAIELKKMKKENEQLRKELAVLKHAALILGTRKC